MLRFERWRALIQQAHTERELVNLLRDYVATWLPSDLEKLPEPCRNLSFGDADDLLELAVHLTTCELKFAGDGEARELLDELARTFVIAAIRVGQLRPGPLSGLASPQPA